MKKKRFIIILFITIVILAIMITNSFAMKNQYKIDFKTVLVTATNLYVRSGQ